MKLVLALALWLLNGPCAWAETVNRIVAVVNNEVITEGDVASHLNALSEDDQAAPAADTKSSDMRQAVLRRLIDQRLILQEAKRAGITVSSEDVAQRLGELHQRFESEEQFHRFLSGAHLSEEQLKEQIHEQLLVQRLIATKIRSTIIVSPQEVARELAEHPELAKSGDRIRASHILIRVNENRSEERARASIDELHQRLLAGGDFADIAKHYSEDPNREQGGMLGWVAPGELMPELDAALFSLKPGGLSAPIRTRLGFHLIKMEERREASSLSIQEANEAVYERLYQRKFREAFTRWLGDVKQRAYISILPSERS